MKIKFDLDADLPLKETLKLCSTTKLLYLFFRAANATTFFSDKYLYKL